jgi:hypothetical protein
MENEEMLRKFSRPMREALEKIIARCEKAGIEYGWQALFEGEYSFLIYMPQGTSKSEIPVFDVRDANELLDFGFEKCVFVEGYLEAICCYDEEWVEAVVESIRPVRSKAGILSSLTGRDYDGVAKDVKKGKDIRLDFVKGGDNSVRVLIGDPSEGLLAMMPYLEKVETVSVRLEGLQMTTNVEAAGLLGRVTNSLFFELRKKRGVDLFIRRHYEVKTSGWVGKSRGRRVRESKVGFPKFEYDKEPIELYWHAVSAYNMPLLQYLAYYQILEYYFVKYSMLEAKKEVINCLKDPLFDADDDNDIGKIVTSVSGKIGPHVKERDLLCDTIRGCMSKEELVSEISDGALKDYFKNECKVVSDYKVSQENKDIDIREQLAERIYDIRCRIVHTKEDDKRGRIMPFTKEEVLLRRFDLPMIESLADKILIANSKKLSFR